MMDKSLMGWSVTLLLVALTPLCTCITQETRCDEGYFGSQCQYKCRCQNNTCDHQGSCIGGFTCEKGWFGPACQYKNLVANDEWLAPPPWLTDDDDDTCNPDPGVKSVSVWLMSYPSWLRIHVNDSSHLFDINVTFSSGDNSTRRECQGMILTMVSCNTLDIHCDLKTFSEPFDVAYLLLSGLAVPSLCSVYATGGRNVAVRQKTAQSSTSSRPFSDSSFAVDGINGYGGPFTDEIFNSSQTAVDGSDKNPTWSLTLSRPHVYTSFTVNKPSAPHKAVKVSTYTSNCTRLQCDIIEADDSWASGFTEIRNPDSSKINVPIIGLTIRYASGEVITMYELELFGETACRPGKYGRDCEHTCNCAVKDEACYVSTGGCPSGCAPGYQGESCDQPCLPGQCSVGCSVNCSQSCHIPHQQLNQPSSRIVSDICLDGCQDDYQELTCSFTDISRGLTCYDHTSTQYIYIGICVGLGLLVIIIIVVSLYRRQTAALSESEHHVQLSPQSSIDYQRIH